MSKFISDPSQNPTIKAGAGLSSRKIAASAIIVLVVIILGGAVYFNSKLQAQPDIPITPDFSRALGPASAPVTIVEYGDYGCPTCKAWSKAGIIDKVRAKYGDQVRFVWRDFPVITVDSPKAAEAGFCANDQGRFWAYHDFVFEKSPAIKINDLKSYAAQLGLNVDAFNQCLDSGRHRADVVNNFNDALNHNLIFTPSFLINGRPIYGPASADQLSAFIDASLSRSK
jgi:protein-disulfide isomerase